MRFIAFDVGEVLATINFSEFHNVFFESDMGYDSDMAHDSIDPQDFLDGLWSKQDVGLTTIDQEIKSQFGSTAYWAWSGSLMKAWNKSIEFNPVMIEFMNGLKQQDVKVAILSNMGLEHAEFLRKEHPGFFKGCDLHLSCEVGIRKPAKLFYQSFLMDHPEYRGCVYLDDRPENIERGLSYGFQAIHFDLSKLKGSPEKLNETLDNIKSQIFV